MRPCSAIIAAKPAPAEAPTLYIITRRDLPHGFRAAQLVHAGRAIVGDKPHPHENVVILTVADEPALLALAAVLRNGGVHPMLVNEPDPPWNWQATAIALPPADRERYRRFLSNLPLLR